MWGNQRNNLGLNQLLDFELWTSYGAKAKSMWFVA